MQSDRLEELLTRTDAQLRPRPAAGALAKRVRVRAARRSRVQIGLAVIASLAIAMVIMHGAHQRSRLAGTHSPVATVLDVNKCRAELARLDALAKVYRRGAEQIEAVRHEEAALEETERQLLLARDPLAHLAEARDRAARIMLLDADRLQGMPGEQPRAQAIYRRAVQLFPDTVAAREAADRLKGAGA